MEPSHYVILEKAVGETPLQCMETWRSKMQISSSIPLTYAGRLDPMASGQLLVLVGEECKKKDDYLGLDKTYEFSVLLGIVSDTHDVLGRLQTDSTARKIDSESSSLHQQIQRICEEITGDIELPYPHYSSKTVDGKHLFQWALEGRLNEITIPTKRSAIYSLQLTSTETVSKSNLVSHALEKINKVTKVTDTRKSLGSDFRRIDVCADWKAVATNDQLPNTFTIIHFTCIASSGTYMRTLAKLIGEKLHTGGLAWHIHRTTIGSYNAETQDWVHVY